MNLTMPSNDKNLQDEQKNESKASQTITIYVCGNDKIYHIDGIPNYDDPTCLKETTWGKDGIRKVLIEHVTEDGSTPVQEVMAAKAKLDQKKLENPSQWPDSLYDKELNKIKKGDIDGQKVPTLTIVIKCTDESSYKNMVDALDEMQICSIGTYVIDKISDDDLKLLEKRGIK